MEGTVVKAALSGRELAQQRRRAMAQQGRNGLAAIRDALRTGSSSVSPAAVAAACGCASSGETTASSGNDGVSLMLAMARGESGSVETPSSQSVAPTVALPAGRLLAQARRAALAKNGKAGMTRVAQATRLATTMPDRNWKEALERGATGRQLAQQRRTLIAVAGRAGLVDSTQPTAKPRPTGRVRPTPAVRAAAHTEEGHTLSGQRVTGTQVESSPKVTGMEKGQCRVITGTEYLGQEAYQTFCGSRPEPVRPPKVTFTHTPGGETVSGVHPGFSPKVTGLEHGACLPVTGTRYLAEEDLAVCDQIEKRAPEKVLQVTSRGGNEVTGVPIVRSPKVTGGEAGADRQITGTQYAMARRRGGRDELPLSEPQSGRNPMAQAAPAVAECCAQTQPAGFSHVTATGDVPAAGGGRITGDERGACEPVTGTPYLGPDNLHGSCSLSGRWLTRYPELAQSDLPPPPRDFSVRSPAREAWERRQRITGNVSGSMDDGRVTGPGMKGQGLITGTPEFRYGRAAAGEAAPSAFPSTHRLTGEGGAPQTVRITGDAWGNDRRVTGTEGTSALRNPTRQGMPRPMGVHARHFRAVEREEVPLSPITGSSGNTPRGAVVTVSGGARG